MKELERAVSVFKHNISQRDSVKLGNETMLSRVLRPVYSLPAVKDWTVCSPCGGDGCERCGQAGYDISGAGINPEKLLNNSD
jgi:hypothetical protein